MNSWSSEGGEVVRDGKVLFSRFLPVVIKASFGGWG